MGRCSRHGAAGLSLAVVGVVALLSGCGSAERVRPAGIQTEAHQRYLEGLQELTSGNYVKAQTHFTEVAASPSYFKVTALASLRIGDTLYYQGQYQTAAMAYQEFVKRYAGDPNVPYAQFRIADCYYQQIPSGFFLLPPVYERDLSRIRSAYGALSRFVSRYPGHRFAVRAERMLGECARHLYEHAIYVADFYEARNKPVAVAQRLESALREFPEFALSERTLLRLARAYADARDREGTRTTLERYLSVYPDGEDAERVQSWLAVLAGQEGGDDEEDDESAPEE